MTIGDFSFNFVNQIEIESSWENLTDRASIVLPKNLVYKKNGVIQEVITAGENALWKRGDRVSITLGYLLDNESLEVATRFTGYLTKITPKLPLEFECEDDMWLLKQTPVENYSKNNVSLDQLLKDILPEGTEFQADPFEFSLRFSRVTVAEVFDFLKSKFGISTYFQDGILYAGFAYKNEFPENPKQFTFQSNIISDNLDYVREDDIDLNVTVVNVLKDNSRQEVTVGSPQGEKRTLYTYNLSSDSLNNFANENLKKLKYEGFRGSFTTFLNPRIKHGDQIKLVNKLIPDQNGVYLVKRVVTTYGMGGGRQEITLDRKL